MERIHEHLSRSERIAAIVHTHADLDSVGSAVGLAATLDAEVDIAIPSDTQSEASTLLEGYPVVKEPDFSAYDLQVVVDAPSQQRVAPFDPTEDDTPLVIIDHHEPDDLRTAADASFVDTESPATALLVAKILRQGGWEIPPAGAMALAAGSLDDTGFRAVVMPEGQQETLDLLQAATAASESLADIWETEPSWSERMATTKAVVRADGYKAGQTLLLVSRVGGHETAAAHTLLAGGAEIAIIISERGNHTRVVTRAAEPITGELSLPENVLHPLTEEFDGHGGGHAGAGTAKLESGSLDAIEKAAVECIERTLGVQFGKLS